MYEYEQLYIAHILVYMNLYINYLRRLFCTYYLSIFSANISKAMKTRAAIRNHFQI